MKKLIVSAFLACFVFAPLSLFAAEQTVDMSIEKMTCALCPVTVRKAMEQVDGVVEVEVDYETKTATVRFDDAKTTESKIAQASTDVGYPATPVSE